jgi:anti-anti-sigma factor
MAEPPPCRYVTSSLEQEVLILTLNITHLQDEKMADALLQELQANVDYYGARKVVIDLQRIKYISSVAFRPLLHLRRQLREADGRLVLCGLSPVIGDVFYTTRLVSPDGAFAAPFELEADAVAAVARLNLEAPPT